MNSLDKTDDEYYGDDSNIDLYQGEEMDIEDGIDHHEMEKVNKFIILRFWFWVAVCSIFNGFIFAIMKESDYLSWPRWFCYLPFFSFWVLDLIIVVISLPLLLIIYLIKRPHMYELIPSGRRRHFGWSMWFGSSQFTTGLLLILLKWETSTNAILPPMFILHPWISLTCAAFLYWFSKKANQHFGGDEPIRFYDDDDDIPASILASRQQHNE